MVLLDILNARVMSIAVCRKHEGSVRHCFSELTGERTSSPNTVALGIFDSFSKKVTLSFFAPMSLQDVNR